MSIFASDINIFHITNTITPIDKPDINTTNPICESENYREEILNSLPKLMWLDGIPRGMEAFSAELDDNDNDLKEKLNPNNFNFSFDDKVKLNVEEILPKENVEIVKKDIEEKYSEFQKCLEQVKKELDEIK